MFLCMEGTSGSLLFVLPKTMLQLIFQKPASALFCWCNTHSDRNYVWKSSIWRLMIAKSTRKVILKAANFANRAWLPWSKCFKTKWATPGKNLLLNSSIRLALHLSKRNIFWSITKSYPLLHPCWFKQTYTFDLWFQTIKNLGFQLL